MICFELLRQKTHKEQTHEEKQMLYKWSITFENVKNNSDFIGKALINRY